MLKKAMSVFLIFAVITQMSFPHISHYPGRRQLCSRRASDR